MHERTIRLSIPLRDVRRVAPDDNSFLESNTSVQSNSHERIEEEWNALRQMMSGIGEAIQELELRRQNSLQELQQVAIELAIEIAAALVHDKVQRDEFPVEKQVEAIVNELGSQAAVTLKMHPDDLSLLNRRLDGREAPWNDKTDLTLVADASLARGECRAEAGDFGMMANLEQQLTEIRKQLLENMNDAQDERRQSQANDRGMRRFPDRRETA